MEVQVSLIFDVNNEKVISMTKDIHGKDVDNIKLEGFVKEALKGCVNTVLQDHFKDTIGLELVFVS